jgi:hypothetical protein
LRGSMPITWSVEPDALVLVYKGDYGTVDFRRALTEALSHAHGKPLLLDGRESAMVSSAADTQERVDLMRSLMPPLQPRVAVVAADAVRSGVANVMKVQAERVGVEFQVFGNWELEDARLWLRKERP